MDSILTITLIALFYYLVFIFAANKIVLRKFRMKSLEEDRNQRLSTYFILALNINVICALFLTQDSVMNYMTYLIKDDFRFFNVFTAGSVIIITNAVLIFISYILGSLLTNIIGIKEAFYMHPILWITVNLILLKLTILYYEAYIITQSVTIF